MVDDEIDRDERLDLPWILTGTRHRRAHRREVDRGRHAGVVLEEDARGPEGDRDVGAGGVTRERGGRARLGLAGRAQHLLEKDLHRHRETPDVAGMRDGEVGEVRSAESLFLRIRCHRAQRYARAQA
ncbi:MAG: hypothetical protein AUH44_00990 [Chloroflexi bacterium 13_1_40CM_68_15]|nr:MAG: hypothetical protein AUH44_00990 [Chloroflexi bacterium 13_1_40CM_68_15]